jgi:drug/metabolite transporter (DMT)-like permease
MGLCATTVTTYLWNWGLSHVPASQAGVFINLEPVIGAILGVIVFSDILGPYALVGGVLVVGAAIYVASSENHPEDRSRERAIA